MAKEKKAREAQKAAASAAAEAQQRKGIQLPSESVLKKLLKSAETTQNEVDGLVGEHREAIANAVERHHLHKGAFADTKKISRMIAKRGAEHAAEYWDTLLAYLDLSGVMGKITAVGKLPLDGDSPEEGEKEGGDEEEEVSAAETQGQPTNVRQFGGRGRGQAGAAAE